MCPNIKEALQDLQTLKKRRARMEMGVEEGTTQKEYNQLCTCINKLENEEIKIGEKFCYSFEEINNEGRIIDEGENYICYRLNESIFIFDKEGFRLFKEKFNDQDHKIIIAVSENGKCKYLARVIKNKKIKEINEELVKEEDYWLFHNWLLKEELKKFYEKNGFKGVVHHGNLNEKNVCEGNWNPKNNMKKNLSVVSRNYHEYIHKQRFMNENERELKLKLLLSSERKIVEKEEIN